MNIRLYVLHVALLFACMYYEYLLEFYYFASRLSWISDLSNSLIVLQCFTIVPILSIIECLLSCPPVSHCVALYYVEVLSAVLLILYPMAMRASLFGISLIVVLLVYVTPVQVLNGHMYFTFSIFKYTYKIPYLKPCEVHKSSTITIYFRTHDCLVLNLPS